jgi:prepilin-type N-terminal cleavage/methylation domain-containing protein
MVDLEIDHPHSRQLRENRTMPGCIATTELPTACGHWPGLADMPRRPPRRTAFTFLELVVVLLIFGIMAAVAIPTFTDSLMYHRVESAARRVKGDLDQLRQTARRTSQSQFMTFAASSYTLPPMVTGLEHTTDVYTVDFLEPPYQLNSITIQFDDSLSLSFDGHGAASQGGSFELQAGDHVRTVTLDETTGEITISSEANP